MCAETSPISFSLPSDDELADVISCVRDWALTNGVIKRSVNNFSLNAVDFLPFSLLPSFFPKNEFEKAVFIQAALNELTHKVAHNHEFLTSVLKSTVEVDLFTKRLFQIYEIVYNEGFVQPISLGLFRSDYMLDRKNELPMSIKQVEFNTIASSFGGISSKLSILHRFVFERLQRFDDIKKLPGNSALPGLCEGILEAWKIYNNSQAAILFVVEDVIYNIGDQRLHEFELYRQNPKIIVLRRTLTELSKTAKLIQNKLFVDDTEIAVVYYRAGYSPDQYPTEKEWEIRLLIERSASIKCPSIQYHLAGTKKIQQALASKDNLKQFFDDQSKMTSVEEVFTGLYSLDLDEFGNKSVEMAIENPEYFVLKPQREGGGNNTYGDEIRKILHEIGNSKERTAYILMDKINPPVQSNYIMNPTIEKSFVKEDVVSELGVYGVLMGTKDSIIVNKQVGHLLRTKIHSSNEGGVAAGFGCVDSPFLY